MRLVALPAFTSSHQTSFLVSQPSWSLSVVFVSAAGQQQKDGWGRMAVSAMRWTARLPCDWARTGCSGLYRPEPMQPSLRAAPHVHLLGRGAGLSGPWAATLGRCVSDCQRSLVHHAISLASSAIQCAPEAQHAAGSCLICPACYQPACFWDPIGDRALVFPGQGCAGRPAVVRRPLLNIGCFKALEAAGCMSLSMGCLSS